VVVFLKFYYRHIETNDVIFLLLPTNFLIEIVTFSTSRFILHEGYFYDNLNILIDKSCAGFNFFMICFCMLGFLFIQYIKSTFKKIGSLLLAFLLAYSFTILANTSRILCLIFVQHFAIQTTSFLKESIHLAIGVLVYLVFLILIYWVFESILNLYYKKI
jgi:exosortase K